MKKGVQNQITVIILLLISFLYSSCYQDSKKNRTIEPNAKEIVTLYTYNFPGLDFNKKRIQRCELAYRDTVIFQNRKIWVFAVDDLISIDPSFAIEKDSLFIIADSKFVYCPNLETIKLRYKDKDIILTKSNFDIVGSWDEESWIYWNRDYGIVANYNYAWGTMITLVEREGMKGFATEVFYDYFIEELKRSLPPPPAVE